MVSIVWPASNATEELPEVPNPITTPSPPPPPPIVMDGEQKTAYDYKVFQNDSGGWYKKAPDTEDADPLLWPP